MSENTIPSLIEKRVKEYGTRLLFQRRDGWSWKQITWLDFDREVKNIASFLMDMGFGKGDSAILISANTLEAISTQIAVYHLGGRVVPLSPGSDVSTIKDISKANGVKFIFLEDPSLLDTSVSLLEELPQVLRAAFFNDVKTKNENVINFKSILKFGLMKKKKLQDELKKVSEEVDADASAALFVQNNNVDLSQGDIIKAISSISSNSNGIGTEDQSFSYISAATPFSLIISYLNFLNNTRSATAESREEFFKDIPEVMPTVLYETAEGLTEFYKRSMSTHSGGLSAEKKLRKDMGGRVKYIFTDVMPEPNIESVYKRAGASFSIVPELGVSNS